MALADAGAPAPTRQIETYLGTLTEGHLWDLRIASSKLSTILKAANAVDFDEALPTDR